LSVKLSVRRWAARLTLVYLAIILIGLAWYWFEVDDRVWSTLYLYAPRWIAALPMIILVPIGLVARSWWVGGLMTIVAFGIAGPLLGGRLSLQSHFDPPAAYARYRVMTWNAGGAQSPAKFRKFHEEFHPDLILIQECPTTFVRADFPSGWNVLDAKNGLKIATGYPIKLEESFGSERLPLPGAAARVLLNTPDGEWIVHNLHLATPRPGIQTAIDTKFDNCTDLRTNLTQQATVSAYVRDWVGTPSGLSVIAGDFNMPVETRLYRRDWSQFQNAFSETGNGWGGTKMTSWHRVRIDHVLYRPPFHCRNCFVGPNLGSDHRPMIADLTLEERSR
jgi:vancomycin resistance protein VanJ